MAKRKAKHGIKHAGSKKEARGLRRGAKHPGRKASRAKGMRKASARKARRSSKRKARK